MEADSSMKDSNRDSPRNYLYICWANMRSRCLNPNAHNYHRYGGRGIDMDEDWANDYETFKAYILKHLGDRPSGHSIDRIDNDKGYHPGNVKWSTKQEQMSNRRKDFKPLWPFSSSRAEDLLRGYPSDINRKATLEVLTNSLNPDIAKEASEILASDY